MNEVRYKWEKGMKEFPEGFDLLTVVKEISDQLGYNSIIDLGCGEGRLAPSFDPKKYIGVDIDHRAIQEAQKKFSNYQFTTVEKAPQYADLYLAYALFGYMSSEALDQILSNIRCKWLIVGEILGKEWHLNTIPPLYSRDLSEYIKALRRHDFILQKHEKRVHKQYSETPFFKGKEADVSLLVFQKISSGNKYT